MEAFIKISPSWGVTRAHPRLPVLLEGPKHRCLKQSIKTLLLESNDIGRDEPLMCDQQEPPAHMRPAHCSGHLLSPILLCHLLSARSALPDLAHGEVERGALVESWLTVCPVWWVSTGQERTQVTKKVSRFRSPGCFLEDWGKGNYLFCLKMMANKWRWHFMNVDYGYTPNRLM